MSETPINNKKKRCRAPNFTTKETHLLLKLALDRKDILENKSSDSDIWKLKEDTWNNICELFNSSSGKRYSRSAETLRAKYDGTKKDLKKKVNKNKTESMRTDGGSPNYIPIEGPEKELLEVLQLSSNTGLHSYHDSDTVLSETTITEDIPEIKSEVSLIDIDLNYLPNCEEEINEYDVHPLMGFSEKSDVNRVVTEDNVNNEEFTSNDSNSSSAGPSGINETKSTWDAWPPPALRNEQHSLLNSKKKEEKTNITQMDRVLYLKEELLRNQISNVKNDERRAQEKHEKEIELINVNILIKKKELEKM